MHIERADGLGRREERALDVEVRGENTHNRADVIFGDVGADVKFLTIVAESRAHQFNEMVVAFVEE